MAGCSLTAVYNVPEGGLSPTLYKNNIGTETHVQTLTPHRARIWTIGTLQRTHQERKQRKGQEEGKKERKKKERETLDLRVEK